MDKPRLSFWQIWNMSFGFLGIQFGWGLQMANMSAIYEYPARALTRSRSSGWPHPSLASSSAQIGHMSDCTGAARTAPSVFPGRGAVQLGRPRPDAELLGALDGGGPPLDPDASINVSMEPFRVRGRPAPR